MPEPQGQIIRLMEDKEVLVPLTEQELVYLQQAWRDVLSNHPKIAMHHWRLIAEKLQTARHGLEQVATPLEALSNGIT
jgi:hypothetical protein